MAFLAAGPSTAAIYTVLLNIDIHVAFFLDLADHLAARADELADLFRVDVDGGDARRIGRQFATRFRDRLGHLVQTRLGQRLGEDVVAQAFDLDVHLQGCDALAGAGDFEVHVAQVVLQTLDISQNGMLAILHDQPHGDAGDRTFQRHTGVQEGHGAAADRGHRGGAVG